MNRFLCGVLCLIVQSPLWAATQIIKQPELTKYLPASPLIASSNQIQTSVVPNLQNFNQINISGPLTVTIDDGEKNQSVKLNGTILQIHNINATVQNGILYLRSDGMPANAAVTLPYLTQLSGARNATITVNKFNRQEFTVSLDNANQLSISGRVRLTQLNNTGPATIFIRDVKTPHLVIHDNGSKNIIINGTAIGLDEFTRSGGGNISVSTITHLPTIIRIENSGATTLTGKKCYLHNDGTVLPNYLAIKPYNNFGSSLTIEGKDPFYLSGYANFALIDARDAVLNLSQFSSPDLYTVARGASNLSISGNNLELHNLETFDNSSVTIAGINTGELAIATTSNSVTHLQGAASFVNARATQHSILDGYNLYAQRVAIKTYHYAQAHVRPVNVLDAYALDRSDVYYYQQPKFIAPAMVTSGSVLPLFKKAPPYPINWEHAGEYADHA